MATTKAATLTFRIDTGVKEALHTTAQQEHSSIANLVEVLIRDYCIQNGIAISGENTWKTKMKNKIKTGHKENRR